MNKINLGRLLMILLSAAVVVASVLSNPVSVMADESFGALSVDKEFIPRDIPEDGFKEADYANELMNYNSVIPYDIDKDRGASYFKADGKFYWAYLDGQEGLIVESSPYGTRKEINTALTLYQFENKDDVFYWEFPDYVVADISAFTGASLKIESSMFGKPVTKINANETYIYIGYGNDFVNKATTEVIIPDSVQYIGKGAFANMHMIKNIQLPNNPAGVTICAPFLMSEEIESIVFPENVRLLENFGIRFNPNGNERSYGYIFDGCKNLKNINFRGDSIILPHAQLIDSYSVHPDLKIKFESTNPPVKFYIQSSSKLYPTWAETLKALNIREELSFSKIAFSVHGGKAIVPLHSKANYVAADDGSISDNRYFGLEIEEGGDAGISAPKPATPQAQSNPGNQSKSPDGYVTAGYTDSKVYVDGKLVNFDAYNISGSNYFKLRDIAYAVDGTDKKFEVTWDGANNAINLLRNEPYTPTGGELVKKGSGAKKAAPTNAKILLDGKEIKLTAYNIDGNNYFKLRDIGLTFGFDVTWDGANNAIVIDTSVPYTPE